MEKDTNGGVSAIIAIVNDWPATLVVAGLLTLGDRPQHASLCGVRRPALSTLQSQNSSSVSTNCPCAEVPYREHLAAGGWQLCFSPQRGRPMPAQANGLGTVVGIKRKPQRGGPIRCLSSSMGRSLSDGFGVAPLELRNRVVSVTQADGLG